MAPPKPDAMMRVGSSTSLGPISFTSRSPAGFVSMRYLVSSSR